MDMNIQACLVKLGYKAVVWDNSYEGIRPHELETRPIPTMEELEVVWPEVQIELTTEEIARKRAAAYPATDDLIVALWEMIVEERPGAVQALQGKRLAVKSLFPKP